MWPFKGKLFSILSHGTICFSEIWKFAYKSFHCLQRSKLFISQFSPLVPSVKVSSESSSWAATAFQFSSELAMRCSFLFILFLELLIICRLVPLSQDTSWNLHCASLMNWPSREMRCSIELWRTDVWSHSSLSELCSDLPKQRNSVTKFPTTI